MTSLLKQRKLRKSLIRTGLIMGSIGLSGSTVNALPLDSDWLQLGQILSQNGNSVPPEIIIDTDSNGSSTRTTTTTTNSGNNSTSTTRTRTTTTTDNRNSDTRFTCDYVNGEYTVMYNPETQGSRAFPWAIPSTLGGGWTPERRCNEITSRLESYRADGLLEMSTGYENGYDTVCVTTQIDPTDCRIVLTVPPGQDPQITRDLVFENLLIADDGQATQGVYTYGAGDNSGNILNDIGNVLGVTKPASPDKIDLRPFLAPADGGTGTQLQNSPTGSSNKVPSQGEERKPAIFQ